AADAKVTTSNKNQVVLWGVMAIIIAILTVRTFFIGYYRLPQNGMYPTLPAGSRIFTIKRAYSQASNVKRGDIIVFALDKTGRHYNYIWRVVALPGEKFATSGDSLAINDKPVQRRRIGE